MILRTVAGLVFATVAPAAQGGNISDADVLLIVQRHCTTCHAVNPTHESFREAPKK
jgi:uncharacterized membrane protein